MRPVVPDWIDFMSDDEFNEELKKFNGVAANFTKNKDAAPMDVKIGGISRSGKITFEFNQDIAMPDFIKNQLLRRLNSKSINVDKFVEIQFVMKSDLDPSQIEYYLTLDEWDTDKVTLKVNFAEPLLVSKGVSRDSVTVDIKEPSLFRS